MDDFIVTFDDVIANFETDTYEIIDAQSQEVRLMDYLYSFLDF